jgi:hypothetical protein
MGVGSSAFSYPLLTVQAQPGLTLTQQVTSSTFLSSLNLLLTLNHLRRIEDTRTMCPSCQRLDAQ